MVSAKLLAGSMGSVEVTFWRNTIGLAVLFVFIYRKPIHNIGGRPYTLIFRGIIGTIALLTFFLHHQCNITLQCYHLRKNRTHFYCYSRFFSARRKTQIKSCFCHYHRIYRSRYPQRVRDKLFAYHGDSNRFFIGTRLYQCPKSQSPLR
jgi:hypothetical protein